MTPASRLVPGKFSQMPVRPSGQSAATRSMGNKRAVDTEMSEALTQLAFYAGWPKAWAALRMAKEVYGEE